MDRGTWRNTVHGVAKSQTRLSLHVTGAAQRAPSPRPGESDSLAGRAEEVAAEDEEEARARSQRLPPPPRGRDPEAQLAAGPERLVHPRGLRARGSPVPFS